MRTYSAHQQNKSVLLRILIVAFCVYMFITLGSLYKQLCEKRQEYATVKTEISETQDRIDERNNLLINGTEEEILEQAARDKLGYVFPNEQVFVDISGN